MSRDHADRNIDNALDQSNGKSQVCFSKTNQIRDNTSDPALEREFSYKLENKTRHSIQIICWFRRVNTEHPKDF